MDCLALLLLPAACLLGRLGARRARHQRCAAVMSIQRPLPPPRLLQAAIRTFVFMPGATAATPTTDDNKRYAGLMVWVQDDAMGGMDDDGR